MIHLFLSSFCLCAILLWPTSPQAAAAEDTSETHQTRPVSPNEWVLVDDDESGAQSTQPTASPEKEKTDQSNQPAKATQNEEADATTNPEAENPATVNPETADPTDPETNARMASLQDQLSQVQAILAQIQATVSAPQKDTGSQKTTPSAAAAQGPESPAQASGLSPEPDPDEKAPQLSRLKQMEKEVQRVRDQAEDKLEELLQEVTVPKINEALKSLLAKLKALDKAKVQKETDRVLDQIEAEADRVGEQVIKELGRAEKKATREVKRLGGQAKKALKKFF